MLKVDEIFLSIQCEGPLTGHPAVFIRLYGCSAGCPWCDTPQTKPVFMSEGDIVEKVTEIAGDVKLIVLTGGEPLEQRVEELLTYLFFRDFKVQIETNGGHYFGVISSDISIVCSPKAGIPVHSSIKDSVIAYKFIVDIEDEFNIDGIPKNVALDTGDRQVWISPCHNKNFMANTEMAVDICKKYNYKLNTQVHQLLGIS